MRAWEIGDASGPAGLRLVERSEPVPADDEVLVQVGAVSLNYRDTLVVAGRYGRPVSGAVPCSDAAGLVVAVGALVTGHRVGDRVLSTFAPGWQSGTLTPDAAKSALGSGRTPGVLCERIRLPHWGLVPAPRNLSAEEASTLPCAALTAWHALFEEGLCRPGAAILTLGTGGVSMFVVQFATMAGARVIVTTGDAQKARRLVALGVETVINYRDVPQWAERVRDLTGGGADQIIEVGGEGTLEQSLRAVKFGGLISLIGTLAGSAAVNLTPVLLRNIRVQGVMVGSREMCERMLAFIDAHALRPLVDRVVPFDDAPRAFEYLLSGAHFGKIVVEVRDK